MKRIIILITALLATTACQPTALYSWATGSESSGVLTATTVDESFDGDAMACTVRIDNAGDPVTRTLAVNFFTPGGEHMVEMSDETYEIPSGSITVVHTVLPAFGPQITDDFTCSPSWVPEG